MKYRCSMGCEGAKTYPEPGKCPICGMKLMPIEEVPTQKRGENEKDPNQSHHSRGHALKSGKHSGGSYEEKDAHRHQTLSIIRQYYHWGGGWGSLHLWDNGLRCRCVDNCHCPIGLNLGMPVTLCVCSGTKAEAYILHNAAVVGDKTYPTPGDCPPLWRVQHWSIARWHSFSRQGRRRHGVLIGLHIHEEQI